MKHDHHRKVGKDDSMGSFQRHQFSDLMNDTGLRCQVLEEAIGVASPLWRLDDEMGGCCRSRFQFEPKNAKLEGHVFETMKELRRR